MGLDSLVDIVFNNVGILVILTVFMALISLVDTPDEIPEQQDEVALVTKKIMIPWSHSSQKSSLLYLIRDNRILHFDRAPIYEQLAEDITVQPKPRTNYTLEDYSAEMIVISASSHCLEFKSKPQAGEWWYKATMLENTVEMHKPSDFYFFFWVDANSFEMFREVRDFLISKNFEVGWKPVLQNSKLQFCSPPLNTMSFQPQ